MDFKNIWKRNSLASSSRASFRGQPPAYEAYEAYDQTPSPPAVAKAPESSNIVPTQDDIVIAVMGITGSGKTTFIQNFCFENLNVGHGLKSCTNKVEMVPCYLPDGTRIFLIDTPGFDDTYRSDSEILREIADWLCQAYQYRIKLSGLIYLHRISDVRIGGSGMKNLRMFRKLCGENGLGSVVLGTTMWSQCPPQDAERREGQLLEQNDLWSYLIQHGARVMRQDDGINSGTKILNYIISRKQKVTLQIQHEMSEQGLKLSETGAGLEVQAELERLKEEHEREMREIREDMEQAIREKDKERQQELAEYRAAIDKQMAIAKRDAQSLEASREQLFRQMKEQHANEIKDLRQQVQKQKQEVERREAESRKRDEEGRRQAAEMARLVERREATFWQCPRCGARCPTGERCEMVGGVVRLIPAAYRY